MDGQTITVTHKLRECEVGPHNLPDVVLYRAPVIRDASGTYKRFPQQVDWPHLQVGDILIAIETQSLKPTVNLLVELQIWHVLEKIDEGTFRVAVNNISGMGADGDSIYRRMADLVGVTPE